jgi:hypothetical protein
MDQLIKNNRARVIGAGLPGSKTPLLLKPGVNSVDEALLDRLADNDLFRALFDDGSPPSLQYVRTKRRRAAASAPAVPVEAKPFDITSVNVDQALAIIKETLDVELLRAWSEMDERKTVQKALGAQQEHIMAAGEAEE